ncbi:hypothetical protein DSL92_01670 [Billgrantia gudaonensis]|uniref:YheO-like domain-containing protein n=1 Tax=Billgrantia gudaonensis TaxID=376427 RepID=A0A3S0NF55_9GAMM|nr:hypothetical protein DSL92_01670 [Halomonas gudaonensis]
MGAEPHPRAFMRSCMRSMLCCMRCVSMRRWACQVLAWWSWRRSLRNGVKLHVDSCPGLDKLSKTSTTPALHDTTYSGQRLLLEQQTGRWGLAKTFAPFCEVVVHDLLDLTPCSRSTTTFLAAKSAIRPPSSDLPASWTPRFEQVIANYPNSFSDGRRVKSTSIGIKSSDGRYIAALCMNIDLTVFQGFQGMLNQFVDIQMDTPPKGRWTLRAQTPSAPASI